MLTDQKSIKIALSDTGQNVSTVQRPNTNHLIENCVLNQAESFSVTKTYNDPYMIFNTPTVGELTDGIISRNANDARLINVSSNKLLQIHAWVSEEVSLALALIVFMPTTDARTSWFPCGYIDSSDTYWNVHKGTYDSIQMYPDVKDATKMRYYLMTEDCNRIVNVEPFEMVGIFISSSSISGLSELVIGYSLI